MQHSENSTNRPETYQDADNMSSPVAVARQVDRLIASLSEKCGNAVADCMKRLGLAKKQLLNKEISSADAYAIMQEVGNAALEKMNRLGFANAALAERFNEGDEVVIEDSGRFGILTAKVGGGKKENSWRVRQLDGAVRILFPSMFRKRTPEDVMTPVEEEATEIGVYCDGLRDRWEEFVRQLPQCEEFSEFVSKCAKEIAEVFPGNNVKELESTILGKVLFWLLRKNPAVPAEMNDWAKGIPQLQKQWINDQHGVGSILRDGFQGNRENKSLSVLARVSKNVVEEQKANLWAKLRLNA